MFIREFFTTERTPELYNVNFTLTSLAAAPSSVGPTAECPLLARTAPGGLHKRSESRPPAPATQARQKEGGSATRRRTRSTKGVDQAREDPHWHTGRARRPRLREGGRPQDASREDQAGVRGQLGEGGLGGRAGHTGQPRSVWGAAAVPHPTGGGHVCPSPQNGPPLESQPHSRVL